MQMLRVEPCPLQEQQALYTAEPSIHLSSSWPWTFDPHSLSYKVSGGPPVIRDQRLKWGYVASATDL